MNLTTVLITNDQKQGSVCGVDDEEGNPVGCEMMLAFREILAWGDDYASKSNRASFAELVAALSFSTDPAPLFASNSNEFKFKSLDFRIPDGGSAATSPLIEAVKRSYGGFGTGFDARTARARRAGSCSCAFTTPCLLTPIQNPITGGTRLLVLFDADLLRRDTK